MTVTLKKLLGDEIPEPERREGLDVLFAVEVDGTAVRYLESDVEAARLVVELSDQRRQKDR